MGVVWVHWLMARGQVLKESLVPIYTPYHRPRTRSDGPWPVKLRFRPWAPCQLHLQPDLSRIREPYERS